MLAGVELALGAELEAWLARQRRRRRERVRDSLAELSAMAEQAQDWADALAHARELLALDPASEDAHRRVVRLHCLAGDRAAALLAFDACERMLQARGGRHALARTLALLRTIEARAAPPAPAAVPAAVMRPPRLIGCDAERAVLAQACHEPLVVLLRARRAWASRACWPSWAPASWRSGRGRAMRSCPMRWPAAGCAR